MCSMTWRGRLRGRIFLLLLALLAVCSRSEKADFECPEQFGYYPDGNECSRYFVCVFGGALHESCTGGLFFSVDLQTCDWPRNVKCNAANGVRSNQTEIVDNPGTGSVLTTTTSTSNSRMAVGAKPPSALSGSPTEVPVARKVPSEATAAQSVVREQGVANPSSSRSTTTTTTRSNPGTNSQNREESSESQLAAEEELLAEGFTEVYDVPRTIAKVKGAKCIGCLPSNQPTTRTRIQLSDDPGSDPGPLAVDASSQSTEKHHGAVAPNPTSSDFKNTNQEITSGVGSGAEPIQPTQQPSVSAVTSEQDAGDEGVGGGDLMGTEVEEDLQTQQSPHYEYYDQDEFDMNKDGDPVVNNPTSSTAKTSSVSPSSTTSTSSTRSPIAPQTPPPNAVRRQHHLLHGSDTPAKRCDPTVCKLPTCFCGGNQIIPGGLKLDDIPQMVLITFDDAVNDINWPLYEQLFYKGRKNPHGCPIAATFYVSHEWTDYGKVQTLYSDGHEIASHSITHSFGQDFSKVKWEDEIYGQKEILSTYAGIKYDDIQGMRSPFLQIGGNKQYTMLYENNFTYDSSMPVYENKPPFWPYTLDSALPHECMIPPCPTLSFPGVWEIPLVMWVDLNGGRCSMADACSNPPTAEGVYKMLVKNFERHYLTNRAPFGLFYHSAWFAIPHHREGFEAFLDALVTMDDVFLITSSQLIEWMRNPTPLAKVKEFPAWQCHSKDRVPPCKKPKVCNLWFKGGVRYMKTCQPCPSVYPWVTNTGSKNQTSSQTT